MKRGFDLKVHSRAYEEKDLVYILYTATVKGNCRKLSPSWKGPGIVIKKHSPYLYRVKTKAAVMVAIHDRLKCVDRDIPLWLSRYREKFQSPVPEMEAIPVSLAKAGGEPPPSSSDSPVSSPTPGTPKAALRPKRKRAALGRSQGPLVLSLSSLNLPPILMCIVVCRRPDDDRLMVQCDQCDGWFHGECVGVTTQVVANLDQYISLLAWGMAAGKGVSFSYSDSSDEETRFPTRGWANERQRQNQPQHPGKPPDEVPRGPREQARPRGQDIVALYIGGLESPGAPCPVAGTKPEGCGTT